MCYRYDWRTDDIISHLLYKSQAEKGLVLGYDLGMQKIAIMGFGIEGQAMYEFLKMSTSSVDINSKQEIHVFDDNPDVVVPDGVVFHHGHTISAEFDIVYKTPGIPSHKMVL